MTTSNSRSSLRTNAQSEQEQKHSEFIKRSEKENCEARNESTI